MFKDIGLLILLLLLVPKVGAVQTISSLQRPALGSGNSSSLRCEKVFSRPWIAKNFKEIQDRYYLWNVKVSESLQITHADSNSLELVAQRITQMSSVEKEALLKTIREIYWDVTINKYSSRHVKELKRVLDMAVSRIIRPDEFFKERLKLGKNQWEIYAEYVDHTRQISGLPKQYEVYDMVRILQFIRSEIRNEARTDYGANYWRLVIYGSLFNGRAILPISDIDALAENKEQHRFVERLNDTYFFKRLPVDHIASNSSDKFTILNAAQINPILFVVGAESLEMHIYPPVSKAAIADKKIKPALILNF